jgi:predicted transcriptional regulator
MDEMRSVAKGEKSAPKNAGGISFESTEAIIRLLTSENRKLLAIIRDKSPKSIQELSELSGCAQPNLTRTLAQLEAVGFVKSTTHGKRKAMTVGVKKIFLKLTPSQTKIRCESPNRNWARPGL